MRVEERAVRISYSNEYEQDELAMPDEPNVELRRQNDRSSEPTKGLIDLDSRTVAMEVGIR